jgi:hypothetical protein
MLDLNRLEEVVVFIVNLSGIWLAYRVYISNRKEKTNLWFTLMAVFDILWVDFSFLSHRTASMPWADLFNRLNFCYVALFLITFYFFYLYYFSEKMYDELHTKWGFNYK